MNADKALRMALVNRRLMGIRKTAKLISKEVDDHGFEGDMKAISGLAVDIEILTNEVLHLLQDVSMAEAGYPDAD